MMFDPLQSLWILWKTITINKYDRLYVANGLPSWGFGTSLKNNDALALKAPL